MDRQEFSVDNVHDEARSSSSPYSTNAVGMTSDLCTSEVLKAAMTDLVQIFQLKVH